MTWIIVVAKAAQKQLRRIPAKDAGKITAAMREMARDPFQGDIIKLEGAEGCYRRRVGNYRIFFRVDRTGQTVGVSAIARRTSTTY
jgi:mRNA-degrading endonuclease RelE of RelBE toxin-antitoxin system